VIARALVLAAAVLVAAAAPGCANNNARDGRGGAVVRGPAPSYREAAAAYNERVAPLGRFRAQVTVQFRYTDREGRSRIEQPEGTVQIVRPDHLALSLGKIGQIKFWLGCDGSRYWWLDMMDGPVAYIGRHERFDSAAARRLGLSLPPRSLIRVLCLTPIDPDAPGATQWSRDGRRLGISSRIAATGEVQRVWVEPGTYRPRKVELFDASGTPAVVAELTGDERVSVPPGSFRGGSPWIPEYVTVYVQDTDATVRVKLSDARNDGVSDRAFDPDALLSAYGVERVEDLDAR
jgi:outer membrane lipoprotein-sorting protein